MLNTVKRVVTCWFGSDGMPEDYRVIYDRDREKLEGQGVEYLLVRENPYQCRKTEDYRFETDEFRVRWLADHPWDCWKDLDLEVVEWPGEVKDDGRVHCLGLMGRIAEPCLIVGNGNEYFFRVLLANYEAKKPERCGWIQTSIQGNVGLIPERFFIHHRLHQKYLKSGKTTELGK